MQKKDCYLLGTITKTRGFKGDLVFFLDVTDPFEYENLGLVYVELSAALTPFFIESIKIQNNNRAFVRLENVSDEAAALQLTGASIYLPLNTLPALEGNKFYDHEIPGYTVHDKTHGVIGRVVQVVDLPNNPLLQIDHGGKEILIPLKSGTVQNIDREALVLHVEAPPGLIELYLED